MDDLLDPYDEEHYESIDSFAALLRRLEYGVEVVKGYKLMVRLPLGIHPYRAYSLASYVNEAMLHGVIVAEVFNQDDEEMLELELIADIPLFKRVEAPMDYFHLAADDLLEVVTLRFDLDAALGIELTASLMANSMVFIDTEGQEGPYEDLLSWLEECQPEDHKNLEEASDDAYGALLDELWLAFFDLAFAGTSSLPDSYLIVHCLGMHDKGYEGDELYFLMERDVFEELKVPKSFVITPT